MKRTGLLILMFLTMTLSGMARTVIAYRYDEAGNRIERTSSAETAADDAASSQSSLQP